MDIKDIIISKDIDVEFIEFDVEEMQTSAFIVSYSKNNLTEFIDKHLYIKSNVSETVYKCLLINWNIKKGFGKCYIKQTEMYNINDKGELRTIKLELLINNI